MDEEVYQSTSKIRNSAAFGEIIILIVYLPVLFLVGIEGKMFRPMAQTVGFAILGAFILSLTYIPMISALFLPKKPMDKVTFSDKMMTFLQNKFVPLIKAAIRLEVRGGGDSGGFIAGRGVPVQPYRRRVYPAIAGR